MNLTETDSPMISNRNVPLLTTPVPVELLV